MNAPNASLVLHAASSEGRLARIVGTLERLPKFIRPMALTAVFRSHVPFVATGGLSFEKLTKHEAVLVVANRKRVRNHIRGVHAAAMALLAETATGAVIGMNLPDGSLPLLKNMRIDYVRRASGTLRAVATLSEEQRERLATSPKGDMDVDVVVTDEAGESPIRATLTWAWIPARRKAPARPESV